MHVKILFIYSLLTAFCFLDSTGGICVIPQYVSCSFSTFWNTVLTNKRNYAFVALDHWEHVEIPTLKKTCMCRIVLQPKH